MKRATWLPLVGLILVMVLFSLSYASPIPETAPHSSFIQTSTNDWQAGTLENVDVRNLDALHTPYDLGDHPDGSVRLASRPGEWVRQSVEEPALPRGGSGAWDEKHVAEAAVLHNGSQYMMWYSGQNAADLWQVGLATSADGLTWSKYAGNPVLVVGGAGDWDEVEVAFSSILYDGHTYAIWYSGYNGTDRQVGYAASNDGITWTKHPTPVLSFGPGDDWDNNLVGNPTVLHDGAGYHMWYAGWREPDGHWRIGHATSPDGLAWTKDPANPVLDLGPAGSWDEYHVTAPTVLYNGESFQMWYGGWNGEDYVGDSYGRIGRATSPDGTVWTKDLVNPVFNPAGGVWDPRWAVDPEVLFDGDLYHLWYTGGITWTGLQIGYAIAVPEYVNLGRYTSPLIETGCWGNEIPVWSILIVDQVLNDQIVLYDILDETGTPIPDFHFLSDDAQAVFDISELPPQYARVHLQATLVTTDTARSPIVETWSIFWTCQPQPYQAYLPLIAK